MEAVNVYPRGSITTLLDGSQNYTLVLPETLQAPLAAGDVVGSADVVVNNETVGTVDVVVHDDCPYSWLLHTKNQIGNWWSGLWDKKDAA